MPGKTIILENQLYGKYKALEEVDYTTPLGKIEKRWKCENTETGEISYQRARALKPRREDTLMEDVVNKLLVDKNVHQIGLRRAIFLEYQSNARKRRYEFNLTFDQFNDLISKPCYYCGKTPKLKNGGHFESRKRKDQPDLYTNGIDRIDSSIGYNIDNCVPCCSMCNRMKNTYDIQSFLSHIKDIYTYNFGKSSSTILNGSTSEVIADGNGMPQE